MTRVLGLTFLFLACGDDTSPGSDAGPGGMDSGRRDSGSMSDSGQRNDSSLPPDAAEGVDAGGSDAGGSDAGATDAGTDAGSSDECDPGSAIPDRIAGVCDGRGGIICDMWAEEHGGTADGVVCFFPEMRCARGDACSETGCTCGGNPECEDDEMCVPDPAGAYSCACITPP